MQTLVVRESINKTVAVARESARVLEPAIASHFAAEPQLTLDFAGIEVLSPSFFDELLGLIAPHFSTATRSSVRIIHTNANLSQFDSIGRTYAMDVTRQRDGSWRLLPKRRTHGVRRGGR